MWYDLRETMAATAVKRPQLQHRRSSYLQLYQHASNRPNASIADLDDSDPVLRYQDGAYNGQHSQARAAGLRQSPSRRQGAFAAGYRS
eukprot:SAG31_NODE_1537_length_7982_cov_2.277813_3_plen_88_part_00